MAKKKTPKRLKKKSDPLPRVDPWRVSAERMKKARADREWSQFKVAELAVTSPRVISQLEAGLDIDPRLTTIGGIADAFGVTVEWLCNRPKLPG